MRIKIKTAELLQSIGFALTSAQEDHEQQKARVTDMVLAEFIKGKRLPKHVQTICCAGLQGGVDMIAKLTTLKQATEFADASGQAEVELDMASFELIKYNLPAR